MAWREFPRNRSVRGLRILVRVDWNVPKQGKHFDVRSLKIKRTVETVDHLAKRGAVVIVMTHFGRPKRRDAAFSTRPLAADIREAYGLPLTFLGSRMDTEAGVGEAQNAVAGASAGDLFLLENVRFYPGEENGSVKLSKAYASLADVFLNDAFASCHRDHASVVGVTKYLPSYAGPSLVDEVRALGALIKAPKRPFFAIVGGAKLSTKIGVLRKLLDAADTVFVGGALAHPFYRAKGFSIGKSKIERNTVATAKALLKKKNLVLPTDALVARSVSGRARPVNKRLENVSPTDTIGDIGVETMKTWARELQKAKTIVWNGPVGVHEFEPFSHGSNLMAYAIAKRCAARSVYAVVGGGDTLPILEDLRLEGKIDHVSTGGGAMLEFLARGGKLPGLLPLKK